jgi:ribosome assembly protein YihI (activator of Der GTPase)
MTTQFSRRGEDWLLKKGGFERLDIPLIILKDLAKSNLTPEKVSSRLKEIDSQKQMLLLNLLGGRLALGYRLAAESPQSLQQKMLDNLDRIARRMKRVGTLLEESLS